MTLFHTFKNNAFQAGITLGIPNGRLIRKLALGDFLDNGIKRDDSRDSIAIKAIIHFCQDESSESESFRVGVLTVCGFLGEVSGKGCTTQASIDLSRLLQKTWDANLVKRWIESNF